MFNLALAAVLVAPLVGIALMEGGAFGADVLQFGYPNGATRAYALHLLVFYAVYLVCSRFGRPTEVAGARRGLPTAQDAGRESLVTLLLLVLFVNLVLAGFVFFVVGARDVVLGAVGKGEFRASLAGFGALAYLARDFLTPTLCALVAFVFQRRRRNRVERLLLWSNIVVAAASGAMWGFKSTMVLGLLPAFIILVPRVRLLHAAALGVVAFASMVGFGMFYERLSASEAALSVAIRGTIGAGNTAWRIWDARRNGEGFPPYWPTLTSAWGGRIGARLGVYSRSDPERMYEVDYTALVTLIAKGYVYDPDVATTNVTGTVFGEGVIAFGAPGFLLMSVFAALVVGMNRRVLERARSRGRPLSAALAATFFLTSVFSWLNAGGVVALFQLPFVVNYLLTYLVARVLVEVSGSPGSGRRAVRETVSSGGPAVASA